MNTQFCIFNLMEEISPLTFFSTAKNHIFRALVKKVNKSTSI